MGKWLLKLVRLFNPIFRRQGIDIRVLYPIVEIKLLMDTRRVYMSWRQKQQSENNNQLFYTLLLYGLFGILIGASILQMPMMPAMIILHSFIIFMMAMTLVTDFSSVLLDTADNQIILPRPVDSKTLFMARLIHVLIYLLQFSLSICLAPIICGFIAYGPLAGLMLIVTTQLTVLLAVFFTYILYLCILRFSNEQKIKDIVSYFQIAMTLFFAFAYQVVPRLMDYTSFMVSLTPKWYSFFLPPVWMAMTIEAVTNFQFDIIHIVMIILAMIVPVVLFWMMNKYLVPGFTRKLEAMNTDSDSRGKAAPSVKVNKGISAFMSGVFCKSPVERGAFETTWKITSRDKSFRLQFYPTLGYIPIFIFLFVFSGGSDVGNVMAVLPATNKFLILIYLPLFTVATCLSVVTFNENFQASWIYHSMPVEKPGFILSGTLKSIIAKFFLPVYLLFFVISIFVWGPGIIDDFVMGLFNSLVSLVAIALFSDHYLPFSRQPNVKQQTGKIFYIVLQMVIIGVLVLLHFFLLNKIWFTMGVALFTAVLFWFMVKNLQSTPWAKISV